MPSARARVGVCVCIAQDVCNYIVKLKTTGVCLVLTTSVSARSFVCQNARVRSTSYRRAFLEHVSLFFFIYISIRPSLLLLFYDLHNISLFMLFDMFTAMIRAAGVIIITFLFFNVKYGAAENARNNKNVLRFVLRDNRKLTFERLPEMGCNIFRIFSVI